MNSITQFLEIKNDLVKYLSKNNLEEHISTIISIVNKHYNKKPVPNHAITKPIKRRKVKEIVYENQFFEIVKDFHSKEKVDIWVMKLKRKVWLEKNEFSEFKELLECYDGYYSGFSKGFIFKFMPLQDIIEEATELLENLVK